MNCRAGAAEHAGQIVPPGIDARAGRMRLMPWMVLPCKSSESSQREPQELVDDIEALDVAFQLHDAYDLDELACKRHGHSVLAGN